MVPRYLSSHWVSCFARSFTSEDLSCEMVAIFICLEVEYLPLMACIKTMGQRVHVKYRKLSSTGSLAANVCVAFGGGGGWGEELVVSDSPCVWSAPRSPSRHSWRCAPSQESNSLQSSPCSAAVWHPGRHFRTVYL